ncbi:MAG: hypothetical protein JWR72_4056 [Flavisolibacter sp.]|nr:hypothetical protein [Flavisolibacter sp.]
MNQADEYLFGFTCVALLYALFALEQKASSSYPSPHGEGGQTKRTSNKQKNEHIICSNSIQDYTTTLQKFNPTVIKMTRLCHPAAGGIFGLCCK